MYSRRRRAARARAAARALIVIVWLEKRPGMDICCLVVVFGLVVVVSFRLVVVVSSGLTILRKGVKETLFFYKNTYDNWWEDSDQNQPQKDLVLGFVSLGRGSKVTISKLI